MILVIVITIGSLIGSSHQALPQKQKTCTLVPPADDVDVDWMDMVSKDGWDSPMASKLDQQLSSAPPPPENMTLKDSRCYDINVKTRLGTVPVPYSCRFDNNNRQSCVLKTKGSTVEKLLKFYGEMILTKTDGKTYALVYVCLSGVKDYWAVLVPRDHQLDRKTEKEIRGHLQSLNLSTEPKDTRSDSDPVSHKSIKRAECHALPALNALKGTQKKPDVPKTHNIVDGGTQKEPDVPKTDNIVDGDNSVISALV